VNKQISTKTRRKIKREAKKIIHVYIERVDGNNRLFGWWSKVGKSENSGRETKEHREGEGR
jgi:hypothetical protein